MKFINVFLFTIFLSTFTSPLFSAEQKLIIIRHGEAGNNVENVYNSNPDSTHYKSYDLTDGGIKATEKTAKELRDQGFSDANIVAVYVSPLPRTKQTADILVKQGLFSKDKIIEDKRLIEQNSGDLEGKMKFPVWKENFSKDYHAESEAQVKDRIKEFYDFIIQKYPQGNIVVVTHDLDSQDLIDLTTQKAGKLRPAEARVVPLHK